MSVRSPTGAALPTMCTFAQSRATRLRSVRRATLVLLAALLVCTAAAEAAPRHVPDGFFGVMADGVLLHRTDAQLAHEFDVMQANGVESVRIVVYWADLQPQPAGSPRPAGWRPGRGGVPTTFAPTDRLFEQAARHGMSVLPVVLRSPPWRPRTPSSTRRRPRPTSRTPTSSARSSIATGPTARSGTSTPTCRSTPSATGRSGTSRTSTGTGLAAPVRQALRAAAARVAHGGQGR